MTKNTGVDIGVFDTVSASNKGAEIELKHPVTKEPMGAFITVLGRDSDTFRQLIRRKVNAENARRALAERRGKTADPKTVEEAEAEGIDLLVACTTGWRGLTSGGHPLPFTEDAARDLYTKSPEIRRQIDEAIGDLELFIKT